MKTKPGQTLLNFRRRIFPFTLSCRRGAAARQTQGGEADLSRLVGEGFPPPGRGRSPQAPARPFLSPAFSAFPGG